MKKLSLVYQDCPMCGARKGWGEEQTQIADTHGFEIVKVSFVTEKGREYCAEALQKGIKTFPFFTDGEKYGKSVEDFIEIEPKEKKVKGKSKK